MKEYLKSLGIDTPVPFVHCASHNLNLLINAAVGVTKAGISHFGILAEIFNFFRRSLKRWAELALLEENVKKLKLKKLCPARWSSRVDSLKAVRGRYVDILKVLIRISLESKDSMERTEAIGLKKNHGKLRVHSVHYIL